MSRQRPNKQARRTVSQIRNLRDGHEHHPNSRWVCRLERMGIRFHAVRPNGSRAYLSEREDREQRYGVTVGQAIRKNGVLDPTSEELCAEYPGWVQRPAVN